MRIWKHISGRLFIEVGQHGPWLKLVPKDTPGHPPFYVDSEFIKFYVPIQVH
jgi:hypothetical protein